MITLNDESGIYEILNTITRDFYIGSTVSFKRRWAQHRCELRKSVHRNNHLQKAWNKYGEQAFEFNVILLCDIDNLLYYEQLLLDNLKPAYNICPVAGNTFGRIFSDETKHKMSNSKKGKPLSEDHKQKLREASKNHYYSEETRRKISEAKAGRPLTEETKQKISESKIGHITTEEHRRKLSESGKRYWNKNGKTRIVSEETKQKLSESKSGELHPMFGKHHSEKTKHKISESNKRRWQQGRRDKRDSHE